MQSEAPGYEHSLQPRELQAGIAWCTPEYSQSTYNSFKVHCTRVAFVPGVHLSSNVVDQTNGKVYRASKTPIKAGVESHVTPDLRVRNSGQTSNIASESRRCHLTCPHDIEVVVSSSPLSFRMG
jgi:hypothetical protein